MDDSTLIKQSWLKLLTPGRFLPVAGAAATGAAGIGAGIAAARPDDGDLDEEDLNNLDDSDDTDTDGDGIPDDEDADANGNGIDDDFETGVTWRPSATGAPGFVRPPMVQRRLTLPSWSGEDGEEATSHIKKWQSNPTPENLKPVLGKYQGYLERKIQQQSRLRIPEPALRGMVYNSFVKDLKKWDPQAGANPTTYYERYGYSGLRRSLKQYAQFGKAERNRVASIDRIRSAAEVLELGGTPPTPELIAQRLNTQGSNFTSRQVAKALAEDSKDLLQSKDLGIGGQDDYDAKLRRAAGRVADYYGPAKQRAVKRMFGLDGRPPSDSNKEIAAETGLAPETVSALKKDVRQRLQLELQIM